MQTIFCFKNLIFLQIQTLVNVQHCQYLLGIWLSQGQCLLQDLAKKLHGEDIKEFIHQIFIWLQKQVHTVNYHLSSVRLNPRYILDNFLTLEGILYNHLF